MSPGQAEIEAMIHNDPAEFERLLNIYWLLLGKRKLWWEAVAEAEHPAWKSAVRGAIVNLANELAYPPVDLAILLDEHPLPLTRAKVLGLARERFAKIVA